jgi:hypothetical protein
MHARLEIEACLLFDNSYPIPIYIAGASIVSLPKECTDAVNISQRDKAYEKKKKKKKGSK